MADFIDDNEDFLADGIDVVVPIETVAEEDDATEFIEKPKSGAAEKDTSKSGDEDFDGEFDGEGEGELYRGKLVGTFAVDDQGKFAAKLNGQAL